jgi:hypothetical protein
LATSAFFVLVSRRGPGERLFHISSRIVPREGRDVAMDGNELLERGLRCGIALWRIEDELDWQENQGRRSAEYDAGKQREPVVCRSAHDADAKSCACN